MTITHRENRSIKLADHSHIIAAAHVAMGSGTIGAATRKFADVEAAADKHHDLVLGGEAVVRSALLNARTGREKFARPLLDKWKSFYKPRVDNAILHSLANLAEQRLDSLTLIIDPECLCVGMNVQRLEELLCKRVLADGFSESKAIERLGISEEKFAMIRRRIAEEE